MYVFVTVTLLMSISKRRTHWTFVIANVTTNSLLHQKNFIDPSFLPMTILTIYLGISSTAIYEFHVISIRKTKKKQTGSFINFSYRTLVSQFPNLNVVYFERLSRSNLSNTKFQSSNLNSSYSLNLTSEFLIFDKTSFI